MATRTPRDYGIENWEVFNREYRYILSNVVEVEKAFPWLRHNGVIDNDDEENIIRSHNTSILRAGHLIDLCLKSKKGGNALLEHVEVAYPEHFEKIIGRKAEPVLDYQQPTFQRKSAVILQMLTTIMQHQQHQQISLLQQENSALDQKKLAEVKKHVEELEKELEMRGKQIKDMTQKVLEDKDAIRDLKELCEDYRQETNNATEECDELRKLKDNFQRRYNELISHNERRECDNGKKESVRDKTRSKLQQENLQLKQELEIYRNNAKPAYQSQWVTQEIRKLKAEIEALVEEKNKVEEDKDILKDQLVLKEDQCRKYQENSSTFKQQLDGMKEERDRILEQLHERKKRCDELDRNNNILKAKIAEVQPHLRSLENEANYSHTKQIRKIHGAGVEGIEDLYAVVDDQKVEYIEPISAEAERERENRPPELYPRPGFLCSSAQEQAVPLGEENYRSPGVNAILRKKKQPLVLFGPDNFKEQVICQLLARPESFIECPFEELVDRHLEILASWIDGGSCIDYKDMGEGRYRCIGTETLKRYMRRDDCGRILMTLPVHAVSRLRNQHITPTVILLKDKDMENRGLSSAEEQEIESLRPELRFDYHKMLFDKNNAIDVIVRRIQLKCAACETTQTGQHYYDTGAHYNTHAPDSSP